MCKPVAEVPTPSLGPWAPESSFRHCLFLVQATQQLPSDLVALLPLLIHHSRQEGRRS